MKRLIALAMSAVMMLSLTACAGDSEASSSAPEGSSAVAEERAAVRVGGLKGPTAMGMVKLMEEDAAGTTANDYEFTLAGSADEINPLLIKGELDIAAVPTNVASVLYNKTEGQVEILALNTLGVLYVVENGNTIQSVEDLRGKTIYSTGKGATPEYALLAVLPQPFVTSVLAKNPDVRIALNLTEEWDKVTEDGSKLTMGALVVRKDFAESNPAAVQNFLKEYQASTQYVTDEANLDDAAALIEQYGIISAAVAKQALPYCNIVCITGEEMRTAAEGFLSILAKANPQSVGGTLPAEDFYYIGE